MADAEIFSRIHTILSGYVLTGEGTPFFTKVWQGDPLALAPANRLCAYWNTGINDPPEGKMTFGNWMRQHTVRVKCFWLPAGHPDGRASTELEVFSVSHELPGEFFGDTTLDGNVTDCIPEDIVIETEQWPVGSDSPLYRTVTFDLRIKVLEGEAITA